MDDRTQDFESDLEDSRLSDEYRRTKAAGSRLPFKWHTASGEAQFATDAKAIRSRSPSILYRIQIART
jgi:hypothetical protein